MDESLQDLGDHIAGALDNEVSSFTISYGELTLEAKSMRLSSFGPGARARRGMMSQGLTDDPR